MVSWEHRNVVLNMILPVIFIIKSIKSLYRVMSIIAITTSLSFSEKEIKQNKKIHHVYTAQKIKVTLAFQYSSFCF